MRSLPTYSTESPSRIAISLIGTGFSALFLATCIRQRRPYSSWDEIFTECLLVNLYSIVKICVPTDFARPSPAS